MTGHRAFVRRPFQTFHRCVTCGLRTPTLRDRTNHAAVTAAEGNRRA